ncbi:DUF4097 family beta strand repeat protein [Sporosarcina sp. resist]|uniref:DUF4097 family beta strand repeat-containing protein n=1 Tax=Sporosarcina sp. resist TaxID=2762563 RepID=UPI00164EA478|nr:DUF4097 family beta strand repeat-containing protein [Sporosarcina sp. resist]QNK89140.1 DUF4097 family beta strand repeat protein [Sporosarcina sp. resist]
MSKIKKASIVALMLLIIGIIGSVLTIKPMIQSKSISSERVISEQFSHIDIKTDNAGVEILPTTDAIAKIDVTGKVGDASNYHLSIDVEGSILSIGVKHEQRSLINFFPSSLSLKVYVPENIYESLQIKSDNGQIIAGDIQAKEIHVETDNGKIKMRNVEGDTIIAKTDNGSSYLENVKASIATIKSDNGEIVLKDIDAHIIAKVNNGRISLVTNHLDNPIEFETSNGRINIQTREKPKNATIDADVKNGSVKIFDSSSRYAVSGNGENQIKLISTNGSIIVEEKQID